MMFWMLGILVFLVIIDIIILAFWTSRDPLYRALKQVRSQPEYKCFEVRCKVSADPREKLLQITDNNKNEHRLLMI